MPTRRSRRSTGRSSSASGASSGPDLFPEIIEKAFQLAESGRPGPVLVSVPMDIFSMEVDTALFERLSAPHARAAQAVDRRAHRPRRSCARWLEAKHAGDPGRRRRDPRRRRRRAARVRRPPGDPGRAQPDGQGRAARRPSADARHDRLLGHEVRQRQVPHGRLGVRRRHALRGGRLQLVGARVHVQLPAEQADPHRHRSERDRPQLPGRDRRRRRPEAGARRAQPRRQAAVPEGPHERRSSPRRSPSYRRDFAASQRRSTSSNDAFPMRPERILADGARGAAARRASSPPTSAGTRTASASSSRSTRRAAS